MLHFGKTAASSSSSVGVATEVLLFLIMLSSFGSLAYGWNLGHHHHRVLGRPSMAIRRRLASALLSSSTESPNTNFDASSPLSSSSQSSPSSPPPPQLSVEELRLLREQRRQARKEAARAKREERQRRGMPKAVIDRGEHAAVYQPRPFTAFQDKLPDRTKPFTVLGIESSCDDTGAAVVRSDGRILGQALASQDAIHAPWGGVVPGLARDAHEEQIHHVVHQALQQAGMTDASQVDGIAVTIGPGLEICLRVGATKARQLAQQYDKPFCAVHHLEAHILMAAFLEQSNGPTDCEASEANEAHEATAAEDDSTTAIHNNNNTNNKSSTASATMVHWPATDTTHAAQRRLDFPFLALLVSGGHCQLLDCHDVGLYDILGGTFDDSLGESLDKTARLLYGPGHGGAALEQFAKQGDPQAVALPVPLRFKRNCNFSYAGLKTATRLAAEALCATHGVDDVLSLPAAAKADVAASFQNVAFAHIEQRLKYAMEEMEARHAGEECNDDTDDPAVTMRRVLPLAVVGGVAANQALRQRLSDLCATRSLKGKFTWQLVVPPPQYCTDQGAMSAWAGVERFWRGSSDDPTTPQGALDVYARYPFAKFDVESTSDADKHQS